MIQGQNLDALFANIMTGSFAENVSEELQVIGYVMMSRAKFMRNVWTMQPFTQELFTGGPPKGPQILMEKLRGNITEEEAEQQMETAEPTAQKKAEKFDAIKSLYRCTHCFLAGRADHTKPAKLFGVSASHEIFPQIIADGAWTRCLQFREIADEARDRAGAKTLILTTFS